MNENDGNAVVCLESLVLEVTYYVLGGTSAPLLH